MVPLHIFVLAGAINRPASLVGIKNQNLFDEMRMPLGFGFIPKWRSGHGHCRMYCNEERRHKLGFRTQSFILIMYLAFAVGGAVAPGGFLDGVHLHLVAPKRGLRLSELGHRTEAKQSAIRG